MSLGPSVSRVTNTYCDGSMRCLRAFSLQTIVKVLYICSALWWARIQERLCAVGFLFNVGELFLSHTAWYRRTLEVEQVWWIMGDLSLWVVDKENMEIGLEDTKREPAWQFSQKNPCLHVYWLRRWRFGDTCWCKNHQETKKADDLYITPGVIFRNCKQKEKKVVKSRKGLCFPQRKDESSLETRYQIFDEQWITTVDGIQFLKLFS